jgi:hypothetical protein
MCILAVAYTAFGGLALQVGLLNIHLLPSTLQNKSEHKTTN